ncbi:TIGR03792 family protein [Calothrix rhizosoleniae]|uniref:TIGR03792 family protein n=1 Tax=Calothrix rhizosoleniae TaxID=888997 RepID=UPI000B49A1E9|nr:TIGR03792 family protein [Calothrix rhizosoleniae]
MVVELLKFKVLPGKQDLFMQQDAAVWTKALSAYPGFVSKQVWSNSTESTEVTIVIYWRTREQWKAIPQEEIDEIDQKFDQAFADSYEMIEACEYIVMGE